jgi:uncharacterized membrane protein
MAASGSVALAIGTLSTVFGFWPIAPFCGVETVALGIALAVCLRRNRYREVVRLAGDTVRIEVGDIVQGPRSAVELNRAWLKVEVEVGGHRNDPTRLLLCNSARKVEIGRILTDAERTRLARRIRQCSGSAWSATERARLAGPEQEVERLVG